MQIHEITKLQRQLEEGILSGIKKAVSATKTGAVNAVKGAGNFGAALLEPQIKMVDWNKIIIMGSDKEAKLDCCRTYKTRDKESFRSTAIRRT